jgi:hypothetical protein
LLLFVFALLNFVHSKDFTLIIWLKKMKQDAEI